VTALRGSGRVEAVETSEGVVPVDLVLIATGIRPNVELAQAMGVALGPTGAIATDERMRTNLEGVYAAGDVAESFHQVLKRPYWLPLGDVANKHGRTAGAVIVGKEARFHGVAGTAIFKAFGLAVATTGLSLEAALKEGYAAKKSSSRAGTAPTTTRGASPSLWSWSTRRGRKGFSGARWWPLATEPCA
jgi:NADPH-dependent 2,4-dienoyl-CoA reductase/sulfur reductase-like enzyme